MRGRNQSEIKPLHAGAEESSNPWPQGGEYCSIVTISSNYRSSLLTFFSTVLLMELWALSLKSNRRQSDCFSNWIPLLLFINVFSSHLPCYRTNSHWFPWQYFLETATAKGWGLQTAEGLSLKKTATCEMQNNVALSLFYLWIWDNEQKSVWLKRLHSVDYGSYRSYQRLKAGYLRITVGLHSAPNSEVWQKNRNKTIRIFRNRDKNCRITQHAFMG